MRDPSRRDLPLVYLCRHGQTDWNAEARFQGQQDVTLNDLGRAQATTNGVALRELIGTGEGFDFVASPLGRTRETMERVREAMGLDPAAYRTDDRLKELSFGDWEGFTLPEMETDGGAETMARREADKWAFRPPGERAESYADLAARVRPWLDGLRVPTVAVVHGGVIRTLLHLVGGMDGIDATHADVPQDRILRMRGRSIGWV